MKVFALRLKNISFSRSLNFVLFCGISIARGYSLVLSSTTKGVNQIGHFRVLFGLSFKVSLRAKFGFVMFISFHSHLNYHTKNFAPTLSLKERITGSRKWSIIHQFTNPETNNVCINSISVCNDNNNNNNWTTNISNKNI